MRSSLPSAFVSAMLGDYVPPVKRSLKPEKLSSSRLPGKNVDEPSVAEILRVDAFLAQEGVFLNPLSLASFDCERNEALRDLIAETNSAVHAERQKEKRARY